MNNVSETQVSIPKPSATVVALREGAVGSEVLLVQRAKRDGSEGIWVFPGGKVEESDGAVDHADEAKVLDVVRRTGVRETEEEAGLSLNPDGLGLIARWITPPIAPRRFDTWFFATSVERDAKVQVDGGEICDHRWMRPDEALRARVAGEINLAPPTLVTIHWLAEYNTVDATLAGLVRTSVPKIEPNICPNDEGACILYPGDAGYETSDPNAAGSRNRLWNRQGVLEYEKRF